MEQPHDVSQTEEYSDWLEQQSLKTQVIVSKRIKNIIEYGHFGDCKNVSKHDKGITKDRIFELRWMECLLNNDPEGVVELLTIYLEEHNKVELFKKAQVSRSTAYQAFRHKNPTIRRLARIVSTVAER